MGKGNPNPTPKFQKGHKKIEGSGRQAGQTNPITREIKTLLREAAEETGFIQRVPVLFWRGLRALALTFSPALLQSLACAARLREKRLR